MRRRGGKGAPSADLLVCFPSRAHLTLMPPKPISSPSRHSEPNRHQNNHRHPHHPLKKVISRGGGGGGGGKASPLLWAKPKPMGQDISEPTSPKVTCAGQIRVRPKPNSCKNWQSVMEEIEKLHNNRQNKKRLNWVETLGFKKDIMHFLTCLRTIRFDFRCFGSFPTSHITSDDEEDDDDDEHDEDENYRKTQVGMKGNYGNESSRTVFSKLFMALHEENNNIGLTTKEECKERETSYGEESIDPPCAPPSNALLLMRSRSAPAKSWLEEREEEEEEEDEEREEEEEKKAKLVEEEEEKRKKRESLVDLMRYDSDFHKLSCDIAKETWVVGGSRDSLSRSRSWKR